MRHALKRSLCLLIVAMIVNLTACEDGGDVSVPSEVKYKDTLTVAYYNEPNSLNPTFNSDSLNTIVHMNIFDRLFTQNMETGEFLPCLATSWKQIDDYTIEFDLRDDAYFSNGKNMTAEDVIFTLKRGYEEPGSKTFFKVVDFDATQAISDYKVEIKLNTPDASFWDLLKSPRGGILCKSAFEEMGADAHSRNPVGTGPYKLAEWKSGVSLTLTRNEHYWGEPALTENLVFRIIPESANRLIELETGNADITYNVLSSEADRIKSTKNLTLLKDYAYAYTAINFNVSDDVLKNEALRNVLTAATDKAAIAYAVYGEYAKVMDSYCTPAVLGYKPLEDQYNLEKAKQLMAEAGYPNGITLNMLVSGITASEEHQRVVETLQSQWAKIGVTLDLTIGEVSSYVSSGGKLQVSIASYLASDPANCFIIYESSYGARIRSQDSHLDELLSAARKEYDKTKREKMYQDINDYIYGKNYAIPLYVKAGMFACSDKTEGFKWDPLNMQPLRLVRVAAN